MRAIEPGWATRFYGMTVTREITGAAREQLTDRTIANLVEAHLAINYSYFGAIDKTLSGFVVLDDAGDDYTLLDLRDGGQVWFQDHETRDVELRYDKLADLVATREELGGGDDEAIIQRRIVKKPRGSRAISTPALCARYQWLVWLLAQPLVQNGAPVQSIDYLVRNGIGRFRYVWPRREQHDAAFEAELPELARDPHLAIYWLLHTTALPDHERRARVIAAIGERGGDLVRAFAARLGDLPLGGDLPMIAEFRSRRALAIAYSGFGLDSADVPRELLRALEASPDTSSLANALEVNAALDRGSMAVDEVAAALARIPEASPGTELLRASLDKRSGLGASRHADAFARLLARRSDPWWLALEALWLVHELAYDGPALVAATHRIGSNDRYHRRALQMAMRAAQIAGEPIEAFEADLAVSDGVIGPFQRIVDRPDEWERVVDSVKQLPFLRRGLAWRVLQRAELNRPAPGLAAWAAGEVLAGDDPGRQALIGAAFAKLDSQTQSAVVAEAVKLIDRADHPLVSVLLAFLDGPEAPPNDHAAHFQLKQAKEAAVLALAPWCHQSPLFERVMALIERPAAGSVVDLLFGKLFSPFEKASYVLPRLDGPRAIRAARAMITTQLRHPQIHARNSAGHQLFRFDHPRAETFLIDALTEYAVRFAAIKGPGGAKLDHGKTEHDQLEDVVANLYAAVRNLKSPGARAALVERLFAERRAYWRLANAIGDLWDAELHARVMAVMRERRDARAAGAYAYALHDFVKKAAPLADLVRVLVEWQGETEGQRGFLHYALIVGQQAALEVRDYALVRRAHEAAAWISEPPIEPDHRGRPFVNPLVEPSVKAQLDRVLSGAADAARQKLVATSAAARKKAKPLAIGDDALGELAETIVAERLLHDRVTGEIWFLDPDKRLFYFDGYGVVTAPFGASPIGSDGTRELAKATAIDERALWWDRTFDHFREAIRLGDSVVLAWGVSNGLLERYCLRFADGSAAAAAMQQLRRNSAPGFVASHPYYVPGKGAVVRTYYVPFGGERKREIVWVLDGAVCGDEVGDPLAAISIHEQREVAYLCDGGVMSRLEWSSERRRREDLTVREWVKTRFRNDKRDPAWHLAALAEVAAYLREHGPRVRGLELELGAPATDLDIAAFAEARSHPLPDSLRVLWGTYGHAHWKIGDRSLRLLGPRDVIAHRAAARAAGERYLAMLPTDVAEQASDLYRALDVVVEASDGTPVTFVADVTRDDGRVFGHAQAHPNDLWWEGSLSWILATRFLSELEEALVDAAPALAELPYGTNTKPEKPARSAPKPAVSAKPKPAKSAAPTKRAKPAKPAKPVSKPTPKPKPKRAQSKAAKPKLAKPTRKPSKKPKR